MENPKLVLRHEKNRVVDESRAYDQDMSHFLDVFPVHRKPRQEEALSFYLSQLAGANSFTSLKEFLATVFPNVKRHAEGIVDLPIEVWGLLPEYSLRTEVELKNMTFQVLGDHFGAPPRSVAWNIVNGQLAPNFRFCSLCLKEDKYAPLRWRINLLRGCTKHRVPLRETCPICNRSIPLMFKCKSPTECPLCKGDLTSGSTSYLSDDGFQLTRVLEADLSFLLRPVLTT